MSALILIAVGLGLILDPAEHSDLAPVEQDDLTAKDLEMKMAEVEDLTKQIETKMTELEQAKEE